MADVAVEPVPLILGADGVIRLRGSRITLDSVFSAFQEGATAEEIVQQYPSLSLADVYHVIAYCLRHSPEIDAYLAQRGEMVRVTRERNESHWPPEGVRSRLLARRRA